MSKSSWALSWWIILKSLKWCFLNHLKATRMHSTWTPQTPRFHPYLHTGITSPLDNTLKFWNKKAMVSDTVVFYWSFIMPSTGSRRAKTIQHPICSYMCVPGPKKEQKFFATPICFRKPIKPWVFHYNMFDHFALKTQLIQWPEIKTDRFMARTHPKVNGSCQELPLLMPFWVLKSYQKTVFYNHIPQ